MVVTEYDSDIGELCHLRCDGCGAESAPARNQVGGLDAINFARPKGWNGWYESRDLCAVCAAEIKELQAASHNKQMAALR